MEYSYFVPADQIKPPVKISELKGISVLYENDVYELARLALRMMRAKNKADYERTGQRVISRPTIHGLAGMYSAIIYDIPTGRIFNILKKRGYVGDEALELDEEE